MKMSQARTPSIPLSTMWVARAIALLNFYILAHSLRWLAFDAFRLNWLRQHPQPRYFWAAYYSIVAVNIAFVVALILVSAWLLVGSSRAVAAYATTVGLLLVYFFINSAFWLLPDPVGVSVAAATGIGNLGVAAYEFFPTIRGMAVPYIYPISSAVVLWAMMRRTIRRDPKQIPPANLSA